MKIYLSVLLFALVAVLLALPLAQGVQSQPPANACAYNPTTASLLRQVSLFGWADWIEKLSGAEPVIIDGQEYTIRTRYTPSMVAEEPEAMAIPFLLQQLNAWYDPAQITVEEFEYIPRRDESGTVYPGKNIVLTLPGVSKPEEEVLLVAHFDSNSRMPIRSAPGADDNATGSAALLEAARVMRQYRFERTVRLIWFTAEEQGLRGSEAYVKAHAGDNIIGVINLDMFGYDSDSDRCMDVHVGTLEESDAVGQCLLESVDAYNLRMQVNYLAGEPSADYSDHASFHKAGVGAIGIIENFTRQSGSNVCQGDFNPNYHSARDVITGINLFTGHNVTRAAVATVVGMAGVVEGCFEEAPSVQVEMNGSQPLLAWQAVPGAESYRVLRSSQSCSGPWEEAQVTQETSWTGPDGTGERLYYRVEAQQNSGDEAVCTSRPSACVTVEP